MLEETESDAENQQKKESNTENPEGRIVGEQSNKVTVQTTDNDDVQII